MREQLPMGYANRRWRFSYQARGAALAALFFLACGAQAVDSAVQAPNASTEGNFNIWVDNAPLSLMMNQLAALSGRELSVMGPLTGTVSGRFEGSLVATLASLNASHDVVFDLQDKKLLVASKDSIATLSIDTNGRQLQEWFKATVQETTLQGNSVEFLDDRITLTGHPGFVDHMGKNVAIALTEAGRQFAEQPAVKPLTDVLASQPMTDVKDIGSAAMVDAIRDEQAAGEGDVLVSKPIRWVTDIPGFDTF